MPRKKEKKRRAPGAGRSNFGNPWIEREAAWMVKQFKAGKDKNVVADNLNRRYHKGKKVRTGLGAYQRYVIMTKHKGVKPGPKDKKPKTGLAKRNDKGMGKARIVRTKFVDDEEVVQKRLFAYQIPGLSVQVQLEGDKATDEMLQGMAKSVIAEQ